MPCGHVKGIDRPEEKAQEDQMPNLYVTAEGEKGEEKSLECGQGLGDDEEITAIHPVGKNSCKGCNKKDGDLPGKPNKTQQKQSSSCDTQANPWLSVASRFQ
jgi:hypothetical protein